MLREYANKYVDMTMGVLVFSDRVYSMGLPTYHTISRIMFKSRKIQQFAALYISKKSNYSTIIYLQ